MMLEGLLGNASAADSADVEAFLAAFQQKCDEFGRACDQYLREEIDLGDITRHLSEATADAEMFFAEHSLGMNLEQLQRYGLIQKTIDNRTSQLFETEIARNRKVILEALKNGEYFIASLSYNGIKSSIYMMHSKQKIKTSQESDLARLESEQQTTQSMIKVLKAIEGVIALEDLQQLDYAKIQKALEIYVNYFKQAESYETKAACDERVFRLFEAHVEFLRSMGFGGDMPKASKHISACCGTLQSLAASQKQQMLLAGWRSLLEL